MSRWLLAPLAVALLPHEVAHYLVLRPWSESLGIALAPTGGPQAAGDVVLGRIDGALRPGTPVWAVRLGALAPTLLYPLAAGGVTLLVDGIGLGIPRVALFLPFALWAVPSGGDVHVFRNARTVSEARRFDAAGPVSSTAEAASAVLTVLAGGLTAALVFLP